MKSNTETKRTGKPLFAGFFAVAPALLIFLACDPSGRYDDAPAVKTRYTVADGVVLWETSKERLVHIEADVDDPKVTQLFRAQPGADIKWVVPGPGGDSASQLFVLTVPEDVRDDSAKVALHRLPIGKGAAARWETGKTFANIVFDPTGRYGVLSHGSASSSGGLTNPGEIAVIDLENPGDKPLFHDLYTAGRSTRRFVFAGPVDIAGKTRQLGIVFAEGAVKLFDIADLDAALPLIPMTAQDDGRSITPTQAIALSQKNAASARLFIRAQGSRDIYDVTLAEDPQKEHEVFATLNQHETGYDPLDMLVTRDSQRLMLLTLTQSRGLRVVDADTGAGFDIPLADRPSRMTLRGGEALIFGASRAVHFVTLEGLWTQKGSNIETIYLPVSVAGELVSDEARMVFEGKDDSLVLLDLEARRATRLDGASGEESPPRMWNGHLYFPQKELIDVVELKSGRVEQLYLDDWIEGLSLVPSAKTGVVWHGAWTGRATLFSLEDPSRAKSVVLDGIWLDGFLGQGGKK